MLPFARVRVAHRTGLRIDVLVASDLVVAVFMIGGCAERDGAKPRRLLRRRPPVWDRVSQVGALQLFLGVLVEPDDLRSGSTAGAAAAAGEGDGAPSLKPP